MSRAFWKINEKKRPFRGAFLDLAAGVVVIAATAAAVTAEQRTVVAATAEQNQQNDDPAQIATTETVVTHRKYLQEVIAAFTAHSKIFRWQKNVRQGEGSTNL